MKPLQISLINAEASTELNIEVTYISTSGDPECAEITDIEAINLDTNTEITDDNLVERIVDYIYSNHGELVFDQAYETMIAAAEAQCDALQDR